MSSSTPTLSDRLAAGPYVRLLLLTVAGCLLCFTLNEHLRGSSTIQLAWVNGLGKEPPANGAEPDAAPFDCPSDAHMFHITHQTGAASASSSSEQDGAQSDQSNVVCVQLCIPPTFGDVSLRMADGTRVTLQPDDDGDVCPHAGFGDWLYGGKYGEAAFHYSVYSQPPVAPGMLGIAPLLLGAILEIVADAVLEVASHGSIPPQALVVLDAVAAILVAIALSLKEKR